VRPRRNSVRLIKALQSITLNIESGERVGLIGPNGAGKTTMLKVMAGIYPPQRGQVCIDGHVCPLFEFATGFEMEANGWDNIRTRALLLGMSAAEIDGKIDEIAQFTSLGEFLDIPVRYYSSGMLLRLAFATSTAVEPQILLLDEVMAAGDAAFIESARARMNMLMERASIVVFATHSLNVLPSFCERTILLDHGRVLADGPTGDVISQYTQSVTA
jgi:lipopolysaccharide transport system ATP-binding protein